MAFPANLTTVTVVGSFITPEGTPSTGTVTFTASSWLTNSGANLSIPNSAVTKTLGTAGDFTATIPITDDADISPTGWVYTVAEVVDGVSRSYDVTIPGTVVAGGTVYLADLTPAAAAGPEYYSLASSLSIGTVSTLAAGSAATATITGLAPNQTLNLGIPTGNTGATGAAATVAVGTVGVTAYPGPGTVTNSGTSGAAVLNFTLTSGPANSLAIGSVTKIAAGGTPTATITGTAPSQTLSLGLVTGDTGTVASSGSGSVGTAAVSPTGNPDTGIYYPAANQVAITTGGTQALLLSGGAVSNPTFTGVASFPDGSASAPSITNTGDTDTGLAFPADNTVAIATGGTERVRVNSSGHVGVGVSPAVQFHVGFDGASQVRVQRNSTDLSGPIIAFVKQRGTNASPTVVAAGDQIGQVSWFAYDGSARVESAIFRASVDGTPGANDMPTRLEFYTSPDGAVSPTERMRIDSNGLITGTGTSLGAWTAYTPTLGGTGWALGNGTISAAYCQIGKIVLVRIIAEFGSTSTYGAASPNFTLPVNHATPSYAQSVVKGRYRDSSTATNYEVTGFLQNNRVEQLFHLGTSGEFVTITSTVPFTWAASDAIVLHFTYEAA